jgi:hypothetical protein
MKAKVLKTKMSTYPSLTSGVSQAQISSKSSTISKSRLIFGHPLLFKN